MLPLWECGLTLQRISNHRFQSKSAAGEESPSDTEEFPPQKHRHHTFAPHVPQDCHTGRYIPYHRNCEYAELPCTAGIPQKKVNRLKRIVIGGGTLGVDQHQNQVSNTCPGLPQVDLLKLKRGNLCSLWNLIVLCHQSKELLVVKIYPAGVALVSQRNGERNQCFHRDDAKTPYLSLKCRPHRYHRVQQ